MKVAILLEARKENVTVETKVNRIFREVKQPSLVQVRWFVEQGASKTKDGLAIRVDFYFLEKGIMDLAALHDDPEIAAALRAKMDRKMGDEEGVKRTQYLKWAMTICEKIIATGVKLIAEKNGRFYENHPTSDLEKLVKPGNFSIRFIWPEDAENEVVRNDWNMTAKVAEQMQKEVKKLLEKSKILSADYRSVKIAEPQLEVFKQKYAADITQMKKRAIELYNETDFEHRYPPDWLVQIIRKYKNEATRLSKFPDWVERHYLIMVVKRKEKEFLMQELQKIQDKVQPKVNGEMTFRWDRGNMMGLPRDMYECWFANASSNTLGHFGIKTLKKKTSEFT